MIKVAILFLFVACAVGSYLPYFKPTPVKVVKVEKVAEFERPKPYEFSYDIEDDDGNKQGRQESGDENGNMRGSYAIQSSDGIRRWVEYVADERGFRAVIRTNEPGTEDKDPADVELTVEDTPKIHEPERPEKKIMYKIIKVPIHHGYGPIHHGYGPIHHGYGPIHYGHRHK
ncbi:Uncharacterised protein g1333 [Pycnogonum litorale]